MNRPELHANFLISIREDSYAGLGDLFEGRIPNVYANYLHLDYLDARVRGRRSRADRRLNEAARRGRAAEPRSRRSSRLSSTV